MSEQGKNNPTPGATPGVLDNDAFLRVDAATRRAWLRSAFIRTKPSSGGRGKNQGNVWRLPEHTLFSACALVIIDGKAQAAVFGQHDNAMARAGVSLSGFGRFVERLRTEYQREELRQSDRLAGLEAMVTPASIDLAALSERYMTLVAGAAMGDIHAGLWQEADADTKHLYVRIMLVVRDAQLRLEQAREKAAKTDQIRVQIGKLRGELEHGQVDPANVQALLDALVTGDEARVRKAAAGDPHRSRDATTSPVGDGGGSKAQPARRKEAA